MESERQLGLLSGESCFHLDTDQNCVRSPTMLFKHLTNLCNTTSLPWVKVTSSKLAFNGAKMPQIRQSRCCFSFSSLTRIFVKWVKKLFDFFNLKKWFKLTSVSEGEPELHARLPCAQKRDGEFLSLKS